MAQAYYLAEAWLAQGTWVVELPGIGQARDSDREVAVGRLTRMVMEAEGRRASQVRVVVQVRTGRPEDEGP